MSSTTGMEREAARLERLRGYEILDSAAERTFERIVRMTARVFDMPMAAVSLVDEDRQWFKARVGFRAREAPRDTSFCARAITGKAVLIVRDTLKDAQFADNPQVTGAPHVRFYAGAPLWTPDGFALGTLCIADRRPRRFGAAEAQTLADLAEVVVDEMTLRRVAGRLRSEIAEHKTTQKTLRAKHRLLQGLRGSLEGHIRQRTTDLTQVNASLRAEIIRREQIERERAHLARLIECSSDFISLATLDGRPAYINEAGLRLVGLDSLEQARKLRLADFFPPEDEAFVREVAAKTLMQQGRWESDFHFRNLRTGEIVPVSWSQFLIHNPQTGEPENIATVARDITERKRTEEALRETKEEAEKANRAKSEFLSRMSHELRTPLNAILGFGQILQAQVSDAGHKHCATHVVTAGKHLLSLINEVLDVARIEAGRVEIALEPVSVEEVVREALDLIRPLANTHRITIEPPVNGSVHLRMLADPQRLKQVLLNLLSNAVKYSPPGSRVVIDSRLVPPWQVRLSVRDTGPGIPEDKQARLFTAFDRLGAEGTGVQGTGLGLALSKHLTEAMGGIIGVESRPGAGSVFWVQLPQANPTHESAAAMEISRVGGATGSTPPPTLTGAGCTVLYIEDNPSNLSLVEYVLSSRPEIRLLSAPCGEAGIASAQAHRPDLVLLDLHLPDMNGWDVLCALKADERTREIPVAAISADATRASIARLLDAGAVAYLTKPLNVDHLLHTLSVVSR